MEKRVEKHCERVKVMKYLLEEVNDAVSTPKWNYGYNGPSKKATIDRLVEIRRICLNMMHDIKGE